MNGNHLWAMRSAASIFLSEFANVGKLLETFLRGRLLGVLLFQFAYCMLYDCDVLSEVVGIFSSFSFGDLNVESARDLCFGHV